MKKILFASTALAMTAGMAAAQGVTLSGSAEMGVFGASRDLVDAQFHTDIDVTFTMAGETDGGLTFGATIDLDESDGSNIGETTVASEPGGDETDEEGVQDNLIRIPGSSGASPAFSANTQGGETIFISGGFGTVTMGDTDGAFDWALTEVLFNNGSLQDNEETLGYSGNAGLDGFYDGQIVRYDYSFGDFGVALSGELDDDGSGDPVLGIGFKYGTEFGETGLEFGLGYQYVDGDGAAFADQINELTDQDALGAGIAFDGEAQAIGVSAAGTFAGGFSAGVVYSLIDFDGTDVDHFGIGGGYTTGAISASANYGWTEFGDVGDIQGIGLTLGYDLGGGAEVQFGYGYNDINGEGDESIDTDFHTYSVGVSMSF
jgi:outer membrane protein OmpU